MLNTQLVAQFQGIANEARSGSLAVQQGTMRTRFYFEDGNLLLLDLCEDKEVVLARTFLEFHKVDAAMHQLAVSMHQSGNGGVAENLMRQSVINEEDAAAIQRSMVEQVLVRVFSQDNDGLTWQEEGDTAIEPYDLDLSAIKIRIETDMLISMVQSRVTERDAVLAVIDDFSLRVVRSGLDASAVTLNPMERNVLTMIDGQRSIEDIARSLRESTVNIACYIKSLIDHGLVAIAGTEAAAPSPSAPYEEESDFDGKAEPAAPIEDFEVYTEQYQLTGSGTGGERRLVLWSLIAIGLLLFGFLAVVVVRSQQTASQVADLERQLTSDIVTGNWRAVDAHLDEAFSLAAADLALEEKLQRVCARQRQQIIDRLDQITAHIEEGDLSTANARLAQFPEELSITSRLWDEATRNLLRSVRRTLEREREQVADIRRDLSEAIDKLLSSHQSERAITLIETEHPSVTAALTEQVAEWRRQRLAEVSASENQSIDSRLRTLDEIAAARPSQEEAAQIERLRTQFQERLVQARQQLERARLAVSKGDLVTAGQLLGTLEREANDAQIGTALRELQQNISEVEAEQAQIRASMERLIVDGFEPAEVARQQAAITKAIERFPSMANDPTHQALLAIIARLPEWLAMPRFATELMAVRALITEERSPLVQQALARRAQQIDTRIQQADVALQEARRLLAARHAEAARDAYQALIDQQQWVRSPAVATARDEIGRADALMGEQAVDRKQLRAAMVAGDVVAVRTISDRLNLESMPLSITSAPIGAAIRVNGETMGETPLLIDELSAEDRADTVYEITLPGYAPVSVPALEARGGWQIAVELQRVAVARLKIKQLLSAEPVAIDGRLWLAGGRGVFAVDLSGTLARFWHDDSGADLAVQAVVNPIYAPVSRHYGSYYVSTRDHFALVIDPVAEEVHREPLPAPTDHPLVVFRSDLIVDRQLNIVASTDQVLQAVDVSSKVEVWSHPCDATIVCEPILREGRLLAALADGRLLGFDPDNGQLDFVDALDAPIIAAWPTPAGIAGYTADSAFTWAHRQIKQRELPTVARDGAEGVIISDENRVLIEHTDQWQEIGVFRGPLSCPPLRWGPQVVLCSDKRVLVLGARPFEVLGAEAMLPPCLLDGHLAIVGSDGSVALYEP